MMLMVASPTAAASAPFPSRIDLPTGFGPEGIAVGAGSTFYTGSLRGAGIWRGDLRTGDGELLVTAGGPFVGMKVDAHGRLWVAGGPAGNGYLFDARTGDPLATIPLAPAGAASFVNDVVVTADAAWFTDSFRGVVYRVSLDGTSADPINLSGIAPPAPGVFQLNGIDATPDGRTLVVVNSTAGTLFTVDTTSGEATPIELQGGPVTAGDGILLHGRTLYVVRNELNVVAVVQLSPDLRSGTVVGELTGDTDVPTTVARFGASLYVVNAAFRPPGAPPAVDFWVTRFER
jgi:hypothetical protein